MNHTELLAVLKANVALHGSKRAYAKALGISAVHMGEILEDTRMPGPTVLKALGLKRVITYTPANINDPRYHRATLPALSDARKKETPAWFVESYSGWFIVRAPNSKRAKSVGVAEWGRGNVKVVRRATQAEVEYYITLKGEIEEV